MMPPLRADERHSPILCKPGPASCAAASTSWLEIASMSYAAKCFGKREPRRYYGSIRLNARRRHCAIVNRRGRVVYIELLEALQLPFRFRIDLDYDDAWIDCEFKSQHGTMLVAQMIEASFDENRGAPAVEKQRPDWEADLEWRGRSN
jgi:hypothetical protein